MQQDAADTVNKDARPEDCYILFSSHTDGWRLYELARDAGAKARISPTPRAARASCGVSLLASCDDVELLERLAQEEGGHVLLSGCPAGIVILSGTPQARSRRIPCGASRERHGYRRT